MSRSLRAIAHFHGATLIQTSKTDKVGSLKLFRAKLTSHITGNERKQGTQLDHTQEVFVQVGQDSMSSIGESGISRENYVEGWRHLFAKTFPPKQENHPRKLRIDTNELTIESLGLAPEPLIDNQLQIKEEDFRRQKREMELRRKLNQQDAIRVK